MLLEAEAAWREAMLIGREPADLSSLWIVPLLPIPLSQYHLKIAALDFPLLLVKGFLPGLEIAKRTLVFDGQLDQALGFLRLRAPIRARDRINQAFDFARYS